MANHWEIVPSALIFQVGAPFNPTLTFHNHHPHNALTWDIGVDEDDPILTRFDFNEAGGEIVQGQAPQTIEIQLNAFTFVNNVGLNSISIQIGFIPNQQVVAVPVIYVPFVPAALPN